MIIHSDTPLNIVINAEQNAKSGDLISEKQRIAEGLGEIISIRCPTKSSFVLFCFSELQQAFLCLDSGVVGIRRVKQDVNMLQSAPEAVYRAPGCQWWQKGHTL